MNLKKLLLSLGILFSVIVVCFGCLVLDWSVTHEPGIAIFAVLTMLIAALPFGAMILCGLLFQKSKAALVTCLVGLNAAFGFMIYLFVYSFIINPDPQSGLIFIFGPVYTTIGLIPFGSVALVLFLQNRKSLSTEQAC